MNIKPVVSIILPTYNGSRYITQAIESCLNQTYKNLELIVVDDHSTDETPMIVKSYVDERIRYIRHDTNKRLPTALNTGFARAQGDYLTWTSDDNYFLPEAIEKMLSCLRTAARDFVYCAYYAVRDENPDDREIVRFPENSSFKHVNYVRACFMYSRKVMECTGEYDPETELSEDYDYWIRVSRKFPLHHLNEPLYCYRYHKNALFSTKYWEQEIIKSLVRFRHGLFSEEETLSFLIRLYARKKSRRVLRPFVYSWAQAALKQPLRELLTSFKKETRSFANLKKEIYEIIL